MKVFDRYKSIIFLKRIWGIVETLTFLRFVFYFKILPIIYNKQKQFTYFKIQLKKTHFNNFTET